MGRNKHWKDRVPPAVLEAVIRNAKHRCEWCGSDRSCGIDHIIPKGRGGPHKGWNFQYLCDKCGNWKGHDLPSHVVYRIKRLQVSCYWSAGVKDNGLLIMESFIRNGNKREEVVVGPHNELIDAEKQKAIQFNGLNAGHRYPLDMSEEGRQLFETRVKQAMEDYHASPISFKVFPNPLEVNLGEGRVQLCCFSEQTEVGNSHGIVLQHNAESHSVGEQGPSVGCSPQEGQIYIRCLNVSSARILVALSQEVLKRFEQEESLEIIGGDDHGQKECED